MIALDVPEVLKRVEHVVCRAPREVGRPCELALAKAVGVRLGQSSQNPGGGEYCWDVVLIVGQGGGRSAG